MRINFDVPILDLEDRPMKDGSGEIRLHKILGQALFMYREHDDPLKLIESWARPLYRNGYLELDHADMVVLKGIINNKQLGLFPSVQEAAIRVMLDAETETQKLKKVK